MSEETLVITNDGVEIGHHQISSASLQVTLDNATEYQLEIQENEQEEKENESIQSGNQTDQMETTEDDGEEEEEEQIEAQQQNREEKGEKVVDELDKLLVVKISTVIVEGAIAGAVSSTDQETADSNHSSESTESTCSDDDGNDDNETLIDGMDDSSEMVDDGSFMKMCRNGDLEGLKQMEATWHEIGNGAIQDGIALASENDHYNVVKYLLISTKVKPSTESIVKALKIRNFNEAVLLIEYAEECSVTGEVLQWAILEDEAMLVEIVLQKNPFLALKQIQMENETTLKLPFLSWDRENFDIFIDREKQIEVKQGVTALHLAVKGQNIDVVNSVLRFKPNIDDRLSWSECSKNSIHMAAEMGNLKIVNRLLLERPDLLESSTLFNDSPLNLASANGHLIVVCYLVRNRGANLEHSGILNRTALLHAAANGHFKVVKFLEKNGANLMAFASDQIFSPFNDSSKQTNKRLTALHLATENGHLETCYLLLKLRPDLLDVQDSYGSTALNKAAANGYFEIVKLLVSRDYKSAVDNKGFQGRTPLMEAAINGHFEIVVYLVRKRRADIFARDSHYGNMALHFAAQFGHAEIIVFLANQHKDKAVDIRNFEGLTPSRLAELNNHHDLCTLLND